VHYPIPTPLRNVLLVVLLVISLLGLQRAGEAPKRSVVDLSDALGRLAVPPRDGSPFIVPKSGPVIVDGKKVWCPLTASYFVWMGVSGDGEQIVVTKEGDDRNRVFVGSGKSGVGVYGFTGIKNAESAVRIMQWWSGNIDWKTHELTLPVRNR